MKINVNNAAKLEKLLAEVQRRSRERTLNARDIRLVAETVEKKLDKLDIPKGKRAGTEAFYGRCNNFPNAYKYTPFATCIRLLRGTSAWYVVECRRQDCRGENSIRLTDEQKKIVTNRALRDAARFYL